MNNVLKNTLIFTGLYFVFITLYWMCAVTLTLFWKPIAAFFCIMFAWLGIEYVVKGRRAASEQFVQDQADYIATRYGNS